MSQVKIYLPPPANWQDFQSVVKSIAASRYDPKTVVEYGRQGQKQNGIDVYAEDYFGNKIGIQCKESKDPLTEAEVLKEAGEADAFTVKLDLFIVATSAPTDAKLQTKIIKLNQNKKHSFTIRVDFWNDLVDDINRYAVVLNGCYQSYRAAFQQTDETNHLGCLRVAFDRPAFRDDFLHERNYDDFEDALVTSKRLFRTGFATDRWSNYPVVQTVPVEFLPDGPYRKFVSRIEAQLEKIYKSYLADKKRIAADWRYAQDRAGHYNILRRKLLLELNKEFRKVGLTEIPIVYA